MTLNLNKLPLILIVGLGLLAGCSEKPNDQTAGDSPKHPAHASPGKDSSEAPPSEDPQGSQVEEQSKDEIIEQLKKRVEVKTIGDDSFSSGTNSIPPSKQVEDQGNDQGGLDPQGPPDADLTEKEKIAAETKALVERLNAQKTEQAEAESKEPVEPIVFEPEIELPAGAKQIFPTSELWLDKANNQVIVGGKICIQEGQLEMFACPSGTKEHESVVSAAATSFQIHAMFLALGCNPGTPVSWHPEYRAASGPTVVMEIAWKDGDTVKRIPIQQMIRNFETKKALDTEFVFVGSQFYVHPDGTKEYYGDAGEMVCLSNFSTAMIDIPIKSGDSDDSLLFEAFTENIPPVNTQVYIFFQPEIKEANEGESDESNSEPAEEAETPQN